MPEIHVVTGLPCSGKTTLAKSLAVRLGGSAIVVGDLIRAARALPAVAAATQAAFSGRAEYDVEWLAALVRSALYGARAPFVLDGAAPLDRVIPQLGLEVDSVLVVRSTEAARCARFAARRAQGVRGDDEAAIFAARTRLHAQSLARTMQALAPAARTFELARDGRPEDLLRQALSAVTIARHLVRRPALRSFGLRGRDGLGLASLLAAARSGGEALTADWEAPQPSGANAPVLLFKPGHVLDANLIDRVLAAFADAGYQPATVSAWSGESLEASAIVPAHLDLHYIVARWGDVSAAFAPTAIPGYELGSDGSSTEALDAWWHAAPFPVKLARCVWRKHREDGAPVLNGHIPALERRWTKPAAAVLAVQLVAGERAATWRHLREHVLGAPDPARAHPASLRHLAYRGRLPTRERITFAGNLLHLSAGPLEAVRELVLWSGAEADGTALLDAPVANGTWSFERSEHRDVGAPV